MTQDHSYPDPAQLRAYAEEPMPFHQISASDLEIFTGEPHVEEGTIRCGISNVEYQWTPESIILENENGGRTQAERIVGDVYTPFAAFKEGMDFEIEEDFIVVVGNPSAEGYDHYEATWLLSSVIINR